MNRREFLKTMGSMARGEVAKVPAKVAQIPKNTVGNVKEYDNTIRSIKKKGNSILGRRAFLTKTTKRGGRILIKNPKETTYRVKQIGKGVGHVVRESLTPLDQRALNAEGRKLN